MAIDKKLIVTNYAKMWPREVFDVRSGNKFDPHVKQALSKPGVYVLYRNDMPYYIGRASGKLFRRLRQHALNRKDRYCNFWNFFSAFVVASSAHVSKVEGILIAAMPTDNSAIPRIEKIYLPETVAKALRRKAIPLEQKK